VTQLSKKSRTDAVSQVAIRRRVATLFERQQASRSTMEDDPEALCRTGCFDGETSICVVDEARKVVKEGKVGSEPEMIAG
jgi:hypothetical protein